MVNIYFQANASMKLRVVSSMLVFNLFTGDNALAVADLPLPSEVCASFNRSKVDCSGLTEATTNAQYIDLNQDGTKELIFVYDGGSCGSQYHVFKLDKQIKWTDIGGWCGCDDNIFRVQRTIHNGYLDIHSCGVSGFFDGKKYIGRRQ